MIGLLLSALDPFKMIFLWGFKKIPLLLEIPALKDHLSRFPRILWEGLDRLRCFPDCGNFSELLRPCAKKPFCP